MPSTNAWVWKTERATNLMRDRPQVPRAFLIWPSVFDFLGFEKPNKEARLRRFNAASARGAWGQVQISQRRRSTRESPIDLLRSTGTNSGFGAVMGGSLTPDDGKYARLEEHGFYWSATETNSDTASFYNFGKGGLSLHRQREGAKGMAVSVRCVRDSR